MKTDLHTHTIASGHAYGTVWENVREAKAKGLEIIAITDHGPSVSGAPVELYFGCGDRLPRIIEGVKVLFGVESSIINNNGDLDLPDSILKKLDFAMAGLHENCGYSDQGIEKNTEVLIKTMNNPFVKMISHPYGSAIKVDIEKITKIAMEKNILLEINASYFRPAKIKDEEMWNSLKTMVKILKANNKKMIINSDAHSPYEVGRFDDVISKFAELGINDDNLLNNDPEEVLKFFNVSI
jgi:putative hydrolase